MQRDKAAARNHTLIQNNLRATLPLVDRAKGIWLYDVDGKNYIDGCSGAVTVNLGHSHPKVLEALRSQSEKVAFVHRGAFASGSMHRLAHRLAGATGYAGAWFVNSGSEAVEAALQFALQYFTEQGQPRCTFVSHNRSYHGNTLGALSLSGHGRRGVLGEFALDLNVLPNPYSGGDTEELLAEVRAILEPRKGEIAGVLYEPFSGATLGANPLPEGYLQGLRALTEELDMLLIADEVMTGLGRTGMMLGSDHYGVEPDIVALGKGLGAGYTPIAATLISDRVMEVLAAGSGIIRGGHTYGGNPLSVAVADAVLEVTLEDGLVERAERRGVELRRELEQLAEKHPVISQVRGSGLLQAIELAERGAPGAGASVGVKASAGAGAGAGTGERLRIAALKHGLVIYPTTGGFNEACIIAPPLNIEEQEVAELIHRLDLALTEITAPAEITASD